MSWFYIANTEQKGPVNDEELAALVGTGIVTAETLVWREGLAEWKLYGDVSATPPVAPTGGLTLGLAGGTCSECGQSFKHEDLVKIGGRAVCGACKPTIVQQIKEGVPSESASEEIRREHLKHEAAVRSVGALYILGGCLFSLSAIVGLFAPARAAGAAPQPAWVNTVVAVVLLAFAVGYLWLGIGLRKLRRWTRIPAAVLTCLGLVGGLLGIVGAVAVVVLTGRGILGVVFSLVPPAICCYVLYLLFSQKGKMVFSDRYAQVVEQTPHIKYKMWIVLKILLILIGLFVLIGIVGVMFGSGSGGTTR